MKKKGLIISTVVMVVVLIASLTTATYAWFTASGSAKVDSIDFGVQAASDLLIGVAKNNKLVAGLGWDDFVADGTTYSATISEGNRGTWTGDTEGLGLGVNTSLNLGALEKAVYTFNGVTYQYPDLPYNIESNKITAADQTTYTKGTDNYIVQTGMLKDGTVLKASGNGKTFNVSSCEPAERNKDYFDVVFGIAANKGDVLNFGCLISVDNKMSKTSLGMNAAIHVMYSLNGTDYTEVDIFGTDNASTLHANMTAPNAPSEKIKVSAENTQEVNVPYKSSAVAKYEKGDATLWIPIRTAQHSTDYSAVGAAGLKQLHLIIYICGPDGDCITSATGAGATIQIEFLDINSTAFKNAQGA